MPKKKKQEAKEPEAITTKKIKVEINVNNDGLAEVEFVKPHGRYKKGDKALKHPETAKMLIRKGKAK